MRHHSIPSNNLIAYAAMLILLTLLVQVHGDGLTTALANKLQDITQIASGSGYHTCALTTAGGVKCWGRNTDGQLGDATNTNRSLPVDVSGLTTGVIGIAAGEKHSCATLTGGGIKCWGDGEYGQLGYGSTDSTNTPVTVSGITSMVAALALGEGHSCALVSGGVWCWGNNPDGQVGDGSTTWRHDTPVGVYGLSTGVKAIAVGARHSCALMNTTGQVRCWGLNGAGQLGHEGLDYSVSPVSVTGISGATAIVAGSFHTCALFVDGTAKCWGKNNYGQLGNGTTDDLPHYAAVPVNLVSASGLVAGQYHTCAQLLNDTSMCWGSDWAGQLGNGVTADHYASPVTVSGLSGATALTAGYAHTCALLNGENGLGVKCWGDNAYGEIGDGTNDTRLGPVDVLIDNVLLDQTISFAPLPDRTLGDPFFALGATASSGLRVTYTTDSTACEISSYIHGVGYTVMMVGAGPCVITAHQSGNDDYNPAPEVTQSFTIAKANQTITFDPIPDKTFGDPPFIITATASSGLPVNYPGFSGAVCDNIGNSAHNLITIHSAGNCTLWAAQAGDVNYNPITLAIKTITIARANQTLTFDPLPNRSSGDPSFTVSATASSGLVVTFSVEPWAYITPACSVSGHTVSLTGSGLCRIEASQDGGVNYKPVSVVRGFAVSRLIDVKVHMYWNPSQTYRDNYELILKYFADAIYEMSNGEQKIRNVTFGYFTYNYFYSKGDVIWKYTQWPCANVGGYNGGNWINGHVYMGDIFPFSTSYSVFEPGHQKGAGYTLAHEWGHYYYSLFDEYAANYDSSGRGFPHSNDTPVTNSIMNSQWNAINGDFAWLNFSVPLHTDNGRLRTAQDREYYTSGWETVARPPAWDLRTPDLMAYAHRTFYPELILVRPDHYTESSIELATTPTSVTRSELHFYWNTTSQAISAAAEDSPTYWASVVSMAGDEIRSPQPVVLTAKAGQLEAYDALLVDAGLQTSVHKPNGDSTGLSLKDDGAAPDVLAEDGIYSGLMPYDQNGVYTVTVTFDNPTGEAYTSAISANHSVGPNGEAWIPVTTTVSSDFTVAASTPITITDYLADDHGDTPQTATLLPPDDIDLPGRIDRAGDVDMFGVNPTVTGTLVLRASNLALGMLLHIRVLDADGVTVLADLDFQRQGDGYFFTQLEVQAEDPFFVEMSHQDSNASGGLYAISIGEPLPNTWEQPPHRVFLPIVLR